jgi:O-methyltransferase domain
MLDRTSSSYQRLVDLLIGAKIAIALRAMAEHKIADKLAGGPVPVETLAAETGLAVDPLRRVLRALTQYDVFRETADGRFENTDISKCMRADATASLREMILFLNHNVSLRAWLELEQTLTDGKSRFVEVNGAPLFKLFAGDERLGEYFAKCMTNIYGPEAAKLATGYPFEQFRNVVDVGGGLGHILAAILSVHQNLEGILFDIEPTAVLAKDFMRNRGLADRCKVVGGDFFVEVPTGYDAYIVKSVLHDWDDAKATAILKQCRKAMTDNSRLLIVEEVLIPGQMVGNPHHFVDLDLMIHLGGKERTEPEYARIMGDAGFSLTQIAPVKDSFFSVIEGLPS